MTIGAIIVTSNRLEQYDVTFPYYYGKLLFAIPAGVPFTSLEKIFFPFNMPVWVYLSILFTSAVFIVLYLKIIGKRRREFLIGKRNDAPFLNMITVFLGGVIGSIPKRNFARTILTIWLLSSMILRNAYQGTLYSFLRGDQRNPPLYRINDIFKSNVKIYMWRSYFQQFYENYPAIRPR